MACQPRDIMLSSGKNYGAPTGASNSFLSKKTIQNYPLPPANTANVNVETDTEQQTSNFVVTMPGVLVREKKPYSEFITPPTISDFFTAMPPVAKARESSMVLTTHADMVSTIIPDDDFEASNQQKQRAETYFGFQPQLRPTGRFTGFDNVNFRGTTAAQTSTGLLNSDISTYNQTRATAARMSAAQFASDRGTGTSERISGVVNTTVLDKSAAKQEDLQPVKKISKKTLSPQGQSQESLVVQREETLRKSQTVTAEKPGVQEFSTVMEFDIVTNKDTGKQSLQAATKPLLPPAVSGSVVKNKVQWTRTTPSQAVFQGSGVDVVLEMEEGRVVPEREEQRSSQRQQSSNTVENKVQQANNNADSSKPAPLLYLFDRQSEQVWSDNEHGDDFVENNKNGDLQKIFEPSSSSLVSVESAATAEDAAPEADVERLPSMEVQEGKEINRQETSSHAAELGAGGHVEVETVVREEEAHPVLHHHVPTTNVTVYRSTLTLPTPLLKMPQLCVGIDSLLFPGLRKNDVPPVSTAGLSNEPKPVVSSFSAGSNVASAPEVLQASEQGKDHQQLSPEPSSKGTVSLQQSSVVTEENHEVENDIRDEHFNAEATAVENFDSGEGHGTLKAELIKSTPESEANHKFDEPQPFLINTEQAAAEIQAALAADVFPLPVLMASTSFVALSPDAAELAKDLRSTSAQNLSSEFFQDEQADGQQEAAPAPAITVRREQEKAQDGGVKTTENIDSHPVDKEPKSAFLFFPESPDDDLAEIELLEVDKAENKPKISRPNSHKSYHSATSGTVILAKADDAATLLLPEVIHDRHFECNDRDSFHRNMFQNFYLHAGEQEARDQLLTLSQTAPRSKVLESIHFEKFFESAKSSRQTSPTIVPRKLTTSLLAKLPEEKKRGKLPARFVGRGPTPLFVNNHERRQDDEVESQSTVKVVDEDIKSSRPASSSSNRSSSGQEGKDFKDKEQATGRQQGEKQEDQSGDEEYNDEEEESSEYTYTDDSLSDKSELTKQSQKQLRRALEAGKLDHLEKRQLEAIRRLVKFGSLKKKKKPEVLVEEKQASSGEKQGEIKADSRRRKQEIDLRSSEDQASSSSGNSSSQVQIRPGQNKNEKSDRVQHPKGNKALQPVRGVATSSEEEEEGESSSGKNSSSNGVEEEEPSSSGTSGLTEVDHDQHSSSSGNTMFDSSGAEQANPRRSEEEKSSMLSSVESESSSSKSSGSEAVSSSGLATTSSSEEQFSAGQNQTIVTSSEAASGSEDPYQTLEKTLEKEDKLAAEERTQRASNTRMDGSSQKEKRNRRNGIAKKWKEQARLKKQELKDVERAKSSASEEAGQSVKQGAKKSTAEVVRRRVTYRNEKRNEKDQAPVPSPRPIDEEDLLLTDLNEEEGMEAGAAASSPVGLLVKNLFSWTADGIRSLASSPGGGKEKE
ncbi:unnamed protein product [Amoebophrya sp. A120]|nr:unnamed protein product [Amoebophrya sp. A120]|eukprot:GSA120T00003844001.1